MVRYMQVWRLSRCLQSRDPNFISRGVTSSTRQRAIHLVRSRDRPPLRSLSQSHRHHTCAKGQPRQCSHVSVSYDRLRVACSNGVQPRIACRCLSTATVRPAQQAAQVHEDEQDHILATTAATSDGTEVEGIGAPDEGRSSAIRALPVNIDARCIAPMIDILREARKLGLPDTAAIYPAAEARLEVPLWQTDKPALEAMSLDLADEWNVKRKSASKSFRQRLDDRNKLPVMAEQIQHNILQALRDADVLVVRANTGSGKTTQIPQIILDHELQMGRGAFCNIAITQPRRISATSVAKRVASERDEPLGLSVGFQIRFSSLHPLKKGHLLYCTSGTILKKLRTRTDMLTTYSHFIIDEVHERSVATDCTLALLRDLITARKAGGLPYPKIVLMSATIEGKLLTKYFQEPRAGVTLKTATLDVKGRLFPVHTHYLNDFLPDLEAEARLDTVVQSYLEGTRKDDSTRRYIKEELEYAAKPRNSPKSSVETSAEDLQNPEQETDPFEEPKTALAETSGPEFLTLPIGLAAASIVHVLRKSTRGDILVFLVGLGDIERTADLLHKHPALEDDLKGGTKLRLFKLHSSLAETNDEVFEDVPTACRRIVLATNIAETSITLPDVEHVIDTGKVRQRHYDPTSRVDLYPTVWMSKSNRKQREGRAGRVRPGHYYPLFTHKRGEAFEENTSPELVRMDLSEPCLDLKASPASAEVRDFFARTPSPPSVEAVEVALSYLQKLGALTAKEEMTPLGRLLANIPIHPSMMRAALLGILFQCLEPMLIIACHNIDDSIVSSSLDRIKVSASRRIFAGDSESDLLAHVNAFREYEAAERAGDEDAIHTLEKDRFVSASMVREISRVARQVCEELSYAGLLPFPNVDRSVFESIPPMLNQNSGFVPLLKALSMNLFNSDIALRKGRSFRTFRTVNDTRSLITHRSVNYYAKNEERKPRQVMKPSDLMAYITRRQDIESPEISWLAQTTMITPLMGAIFGRSINESDSGLLLNDWIKLQINVTQSAVEPLVATRVLLEVRKAFERFCILAFTDLEEAARQTETGWNIRRPHKADFLMSNIRQEMFPRKRAKNYINRELRDAFVKGMLKVLEADEQAMREMFEQDAVEAEQERQEAEAEMARKTASKNRLQGDHEQAEETSTRTLPAEGKIATPALCSDH